jgi:hypothetical protein
MRLEPVKAGGVMFVEGHPGEMLLETPRDITLVIEACFSARTRRALLYSANLTPGFFDVSSLEAGEILQKLRNYRIHLAVVLEADAAPSSRRFHELLEAERRDAHFRLFSDRTDAVGWLLDRAVPPGGNA